MPGFIRSKKDESKWNRAKNSVKESRSKKEESFSDRDWALVNHIYHQMSKSADIDNIIEQLKKTKYLIKQRSEDYDDDEERYSAFDPTEEDQDKSKDDDNGGEEEYENDPSKGYEDITGTHDPKEIPEPSMQDIVNLRRYTQPWAHRVSLKTSLEADPKRNPNIAARGHVQEAKILANKVANKDEAYSQLINSDAYRKATRREKGAMQAKFHEDWDKKYPDHAKNALDHLLVAHARSEEDKKAFLRQKEEDIKSILTGGPMPEETYSAEAAAQHVGGIKEKEGEGATASTIEKSPFARFAESNPEFIKEYAKHFKPKTKSTPSDEDLTREARSEKIVNDLLGSDITTRPELAQAKQQWDKLYESYLPRVNKTINRTVEWAKNAGLSLPEEVIRDPLEEASMYGLIHAINTYDPSKKASFNTHAWHAMRGHQLAALYHLEKYVPVQMRVAASAYRKKQKQQQSEQPSSLEQRPTSQPEQPAAQKPAPQKPHEVIASSSHPNAKDMAEKIKRIDAQKQVQPQVTETSQPPSKDPLYPAVSPSGVIRRKARE